MTPRRSARLGLSQAMPEEDEGNRRRDRRQGESSIMGWMPSIRQVEPLGSPLGTAVRRPGPILLVLTVFFLATPGCANSGGKVRPFGLGNGNAPLFSSLSMGRTQSVAALPARNAETATNSADTLGGAQVAKPERHQAVGVRPVSNRPGLLSFRWPWGRRTARTVPPPTSNSRETNPTSSIRLTTTETVSPPRSDEGYDQELRAVSTSAMEPPDGINKHRHHSPGSEWTDRPRDDLFTPDITPWDRFRDRLTRPFRGLNSLNPWRRGA